jgi:oleate hydratase
MEVEQTMSKPDRSAIRAHLVGGGIASLAAAAFLIRDGDLLGHRITIYEELPKLGGSLDGSGDAERGYVVRGGRMIESKYLCTYDLFSSIPTLDGKRTVTQEIFEWNETLKTGSKARFVRAGRRVDGPAFGLGERHVLLLEKLALESESRLGRTRIDDHFDASFFCTNFWLMWSTTFAFQPWHSAVELKRYLLRFTHMVSGFNELRGIMRTVYNQYDSMVLPLRRWLEARGVHFALSTQVSDIAFGRDGDRIVVESMAFDRPGLHGRIAVEPTDVVIATLGSMTEGSSVGDMQTAPVQNGKRAGGAWRLWERLAAGRPELGRPGVFCDDIRASKWVSFTTTLKGGEFFRIVRDLTGNVPGEGGLVTFTESNWLVSIVLPHQPHFIDQADDVQVFWGYGLFVDKPGNFVNKPMSSCSGRELMTELLGHLRVGHRTGEILAQANCRPCMMPFITSQFMPRDKGDRPRIRPDGYANFAIVGQFCEQPDDVVFTVEYSVRSAMTAVYSLLGLDRKAPPVFKGPYDPRHLLGAYRALHQHDGSPRPA